MKMIMTKKLAEQWFETIHHTLVSAEMTEFQNNDRINDLLLADGSLKEEMVRQLIIATEDNAKTLFVQFLKTFEELYGMKWAIEK